MEKILIAGDYSEVVFGIMKEYLEKDLEIVRIERQEEFENGLDADYVILRTLKLPAELISKMPNLKFVQRWGVGFDSVDIEFAGKRGIPVANNGGASANAVAELALTLMLSVYRNIIPANQALRRGEWVKGLVGKSSYTIEGKLVGIVGMGRIGSLVGQYVSAMGAKVQYFDLRGEVPGLRERHPDFRLVTLDELLKTSDIVTLHVPLTEETRYLISERELTMMKPTAILINAARGGVVDEAALKKALENKKLLGAGLDVYEKEPITPDYPILMLPNVVGSCHVGGNTADLALKLARLCPSNIQDFRAGKLDQKYVVNKQFLA